MEYKMTIGVLFLIINSITVLVPAICAYLHIKRAINAKDKAWLDCHFLIALAMIVFLFANVAATYTGYIGFIRNPGQVIQEVVRPRMFDRTCMLMVGIIMLFPGRKDIVH